MSHQSFEVRGEGAPPGSYLGSAPRRVPRESLLSSEFGANVQLEPDLGIYLDSLIVQWLTLPQTTPLINDILRIGSKMYRGYLNSSSFEIKKLHF